MFLGSGFPSVQKYYKTNLIYGYGRTEDIPFGGLLNIILGREINEFKSRIYLGSSLSVGESISSFGIFFTVQQDLVLFSIMGILNRECSC